MPIPFRILSPWPIAEGCPYEELRQLFMEASAGPGAPVPGISPLYWCGWARSVAVLSPAARRVPGGTGWPGGVTAQFFGTELQIRNAEGRKIWPMSEKMNMLLYGLPESLRKRSLAESFYRAFKTPRRSWKKPLGRENPASALSVARLVLRVSVDPAYPFPRGRQNRMKGFWSNGVPGAPIGLAPLRLRSDDEPFAGPG